MITEDRLKKFVNKHWDVLVMFVLFGVTLYTVIGLKFVSKDHFVDLETNQKILRANQENLKENLKENQKDLKENQRELKDSIDNLALLVEKRLDTVTFRLDRHISKSSHK